MPQTRSGDRKLTKSEIRISKSETNDETNKIRNIKLSKHSRVLVSNFPVWSLKFVSNFGSFDFAQDRLSMTLVKSLFYFFTSPGASAVEQCWPGGSCHHKAYDLSTLQK